MDIAAKADLYQALFLGCLIACIVCAAAAAVICIISDLPQTVRYLIRRRRDMNRRRKDTNRRGMYQKRMRAQKPHSAADEHYDETRRLCEGTGEGECVGREGARSESEAGSFCIEREIIWVHTEGGGQSEEEKDEKKDS